MYVMVGKVIYFQFSQNELFLYKQVSFWFGRPWSNISKYKDRSLSHSHYLPIYSGLLGYFLPAKKNNNFSDTQHFDFMLFPFVSYFCNKAKKNTI